MKIAIKTFLNRSGLNRLSKIMMHKKTGYVIPKENWVLEKGKYVKNKGKPRKPTTKRRKTQEKKWNRP